MIDALLREVFQKTNAEETRRRLRSAKAELDKNLRERDRLESLMLDAMDGACVFTPEQLKRRLDRLEESIQQNRNTAESLKRELEDVDAKTALLQQEHKQLSCWADLYDKATTAEKKMICGHMIRRVEISMGFRWSLPSRRHSACGGWRESKGLGKVHILLKMLLLRHIIKCVNIIKYSTEHPTQACRSPEYGTSYEAKWLQIKNLRKNAPNSQGTVCHPKDIHHLKAGRMEEKRNDGKQAVFCQI